ncbi:UNVERIFIED_CONTAM: hypothetical protein FKN15_024841 [Acipenser sinensis]
MPARHRWECLSAIAWGRFCGQGPEEGAASCEEGWGEVRRPPPPAAVPLLECPVPLAAIVLSALPLQATRLERATLPLLECLNLLSAFVLTALTPMGHLMYLFLAQDYC